MKRALLVLAIGALTFASCSEEAATEESTAPTIVGTWDVVKVGEDAFEDELLYTFSEDGKVDQSGRAGSWNLSEDGKTLSITFEDGGSGEFTDVTLTDSQLTFMDGADMLTLDKK